MHLSLRNFYTKLIFTVLLLAFFVVSAYAEMYIHLTNGEIVALPYNKEEIDKITYSSSHNKQKTSALYVTLTSYNYPRHVIRHRNYLGEITEIYNQLDMKDSTFKVVRGLADSSGISFESVNYPGYYLRHQDFRIKLLKNDGSRLFLEDATFRKVPGLADDSKFSFESFNYPNYYIRHKNFMLYIEQGNGDLFRKDTTFSMDPPAWKNN